ncbi:hypothetical protein GCM10023238_15670 [Streptomyces heliomycini]
MLDEPRTRGVREFPSPEIKVADLTAFALQAACWGDPDASWGCAVLDAHRALAAARSVLTAIGRWAPTDGPASAGALARAWVCTPRLAAPPAGRGAGGGPGPQRPRCRHDLREPTSASTATTRVALRAPGTAAQRTPPALRKEAGAPPRAPRPSPR